MGVISTSVAIPLATPSRASSVDRSMSENPWPGMARRVDQQVVVRVHDAQRRCRSGTRDGDDLALGHSTLLAPRGGCPGSFAFYGA